tara:strand:- start:74 stop:571 length:498 start_codon:yes stop_codon:yes gene_type:complete
MKIVDNFLSPSQFEKIQSIMMGTQFPWYFNNSMDNRGDERYQFTHTFYRFERKESSYLYPTIHDCLRELRPKKLYRIKSNLNPQSPSHERGDYHRDFFKRKHGFDCTTSILYINTNNGWTQFKNGDKVDCVENRMVIFDSNQEHQGVSCTDQKRKVVINFNYEVQ